MRQVLTAEEVANSRADVCRVAEVLFAHQGVTMHIIKTLGTPCGPSPALRSFCLTQGASRWGRTATGAAIALMPCLTGALAATVLNSFDWCFGEVRFTLAVCLMGAGASGTLLLRWNFDPTSIRRSLAYAVISGIGAAAPLLQLG